jgi:pimeloyl-ACP methyl ester carboxylesterase/class 3 adenylate cyclase
MADQPETKYARSGDTYIAYQVSGSGPIDIVMVPGFISNVEAAWNNPDFAYLLRRLGAFARLIRFDKRGTGLSDRVASIASLEERMDDVRAVMDAAGSDRAVMIGVSEGGAMSMLFAATYPERVQALVIVGSYAHFLSDVQDRAELEAQVREVEEHWGTGVSLRRFAPARANDPKAVANWAAFERSGGSPSAVISLLRMNAEIDVRHVLPAIRVPTLVAHRREDPRVAFASAERMAALIPNARLVELPGTDHPPHMGDTDPLLDAIEEFLTGSRAAPDPERVLATVMFADIVSSTERARELGDRHWRSLLEDFFVATNDAIRKFRGSQIKTTGDGMLATFDGPARGIQCAAAIRSAAMPYGFELRLGLHTGEIERLGADIGGIAVHLAARVADRADANQILVTRTVRDLVAGSGLRLIDAGAHALKGLEEEVQLYSLA